VNPIPLTILAMALTVLSSQIAVAENCSCAASHIHGELTTAPSGSPYAGMQHRAIKALSEQQMADLKAGHGIGLSLPAELNGHPGPAHVLELADALGLSDDQRTKTKALLDSMKAETIPLGERVVSEERTLDRLFADRKATRAAVNAAAARVASAQGDLRAAHLRYHLEMTERLSAEQIARYAELRGYGSGMDQHRR